MSNSSNGNKKEDIVLARWSDRFLAWLIDFILITIGITLVSALLFLFFLLLYPGSFDQFGKEQPFVNPSNFFVSSIVFFLYWFYFESTSGQSIGKRILNIKTTNLDGKVAKRKEVAIGSFGKSFLLIFDVLLGWIFTNDKRQRIFGRICNTIVIKTKVKEYKEEDNTHQRYIKD
jgi:uncharacterized RDD family membrane protein YckC